MAIDAPPPSWLEDWSGDGVIARIESAEMLSTLLELGLPVVDVRCRFEAPTIPRIESDDAEIARKAVQHFQQLGFEHYGFCGFQGANYSQHRYELYRTMLNKMGMEPFFYESPNTQPGIVAAETAGMLDDAGVADWVRSLPRPIAIFACNDIRAQQLLIVCQNLELRVPEDVAVLGVDNDDVICTLCEPPLSSVEPDTEKIGEEAARLLDEMMEGARPQSQIIYLPPLGIVERRSTEAVVLDDPDLATAYGFIRDNACEGISVTKVVESVGLSRRSLERRFQERFRKTPATIIAEFRLARLKQLLTETEWSLEEIAPLAGFSYVEHMCVFFKRHEQTTPGRFRQKLLDRM